MLVTALIALMQCTGLYANIEKNQNKPADNAETIFTAPPRTTDDVLKHFSRTRAEPHANLAPNCKGRETEGIYVDVLTEYATRYQPHERIDQKKDPVPIWDVTYGWELRAVLARLELRRGEMARAEESVKQYIKVIPKDEIGQQVRARTFLALSHTSRGNLPAAATAISEAKRLYKTFPDSTHTENKNKAMGWIQKAEGSLAQAHGDMALAEDFFLKSIVNTRTFKPGSAYVALIRAKLAEAKALQGKLLEAENEIRLAVQHSVEHDRLGNIMVAPIIYQFAKILLHQGRLEEAEKLARSAIWSYQVQCSSGKSIQYANARKTLAEIYAAQKRYKEALKLYEAIENSLGKESRPFQSRFANDLIFSYALLSEGKVQQAHTKLQTTVDHHMKHYGADHPLTSEAEGFLAIAEWKLGDLKKAELYFSKAIGVLLDPKRRAGVSPHNIQLIIESYMAMVSDKPAIAPGDVNKLFMLSEHLRNSSVEESIVAMGARAATSSPALADILRQEQNVRIRALALESTLSVAIAEGVDAQPLKKEIKELRQKHAAILDNIKNDFPEYFELLNPSPLTIEEAGKLLNQGETLISSYSGADNTYIWTISKNKPAHFIKSSLSSTRIDRLINKLYRSFLLSGDSIQDIKPFDVDTAHEIFKGILEPSEHIWENSHTLFIATHGSLGRLPLTALPTQAVKLNREAYPFFSRYKDVPFLVKKHAVSTIPSVGALRALRSIEKMSKKRETFIAFGDPLFNKAQANSNNSITAASNVVSRGGVYLRSAPGLTGLSSANLHQLPRLPETAEELRDIAKALKVNSDKYVYLRDKANEEAVKSMDLEQYKIIAFATHGLVPGDLDGLTQPALALSAPEINNTQGDGLLGMDEIMNLKLNADWVILSACNTGSSDNESAEAVSGLGRAFFYAGARSLLVSNWPVETNSARMLTTGVFHSSGKDTSRAQSLRQSILKLIGEGAYLNPTDGKPVFHYAHPFFWAPFSLVGDTI